MAIALHFLCSPSPAHSQIIVGHAIAIDGDTLDTTGSRIRLFGIDAPEASQQCQRGAEPWACGRDATVTLAGLLNGAQISCQQREIDTYGRAVATCATGGLDLGLAMIEA